MLKILLDTTLNQALCKPQTAFNTVQHTLCDLKPALNANETKLTIFTKSKKIQLDFPSTTTLLHNESESLTQYKCLGTLIDDSLFLSLILSNLWESLSRN